MRGYAGSELDRRRHDDIVLLTKSGWNTKLIAKHLDIHVETVRTHLRNADIEPTPAQWARYHRHLERRKSK